VLAELADDLRAIAQRALAFAAEDRFASIDDLRLAIAEAQRARTPAGAIDLARLISAGRSASVST
jgi:hypothetical protein